jgi:hypothetical protein
LIIKKEVVDGIRREHIRKPIYWYLKTGDMLNYVEFSAFYHALISYIIIIFDLFGELLSV